MLKKLKAWLIHLLGGYTDAEYQQCANALAELSRINPIQTETLRPVTLRVSYSYPDDTYDWREARKRAQARVRIGLEDAAFRYMTIHATRDEESQTITMEGTLRVLDEEVRDA